MKALLIYPKRDPRSKLRTQFDWQKVFELSFWPFPVRGYGLYVNVLDTLASLSPPGVDVHVVNENIDPIPFEADVDLVGISCMVTNATRAYEIADVFRKRKIPVVMGGYHPFTLSLFGMQDEVLQHADSICISEADDAWADILRDAERGTLQQTYTQARRTDVTAVQHRCISSPRHWLRHGYLTIQASRGCPFHCSFCSIIEMLGNDMRYKSPEAIVAELEPIYQKDIMGRYFGRPLFLVDDNIYGTPAEFRKILRALIALNAKYPGFKPYYGSQLTINVTKDREALELMREAAFNTVFVGLESLDPVVLRSYEKFHNVAFDYATAIATLRRYGIEMVASFIFGQDVEGEGVFEEVFQFFQRNHSVYPYFNILTPGARQFQQMRSEGRLLSQDWRLYDAQHTVFVPMKMRPVELQRRFVDLVQRVFDYENIKKRLIGAFVEGGSRQMTLSPAMQVFFFLKTLAALASQGDREGIRFLLDLRPYILSNKLSMFSLMFQIDQHDYAAKNVLTLTEHPYDLDVPSWEERLASLGPKAAAAVPLPQASA